MTVKQRPRELSFKVPPVPPKPHSSLIPGLLGIRAKCFSITSPACYLPQHKGTTLGQNQHLDVLRRALLIVITTSIIIGFKRRQKKKKKWKDRRKDRLKQVRKARRSSYLSTAVSPFLTIMLSTAAQGKSTLCPAGRQEGSRQQRLSSTAASHWFEQQAPCTNSIMSIPARAAHSPEAFSSHSPTPWCWRVFPGTRRRATGFFSPFFLMGGWVSFLSFFPPSSCWMLFLSLFWPPLFLLFAVPPSLPSHPLAPHYTSSR